KMGSVSSLEPKTARTMSRNSTNQPTDKPNLHPRNPHRFNYNLEALVKSTPDLDSYIVQNEHGKTTLDFSNPIAVKLLNKALLKHHYQLVYWDIPLGFLCPAVPGRVDYI